MRFHLYIIATLLAFALGSCAKEREEPTPDPARVLIAYIGTDNNLSGLETEKMQGLRDGWTGKNTDKIIAYVDNRNSGGKLYDLSVSKDSDPFILASYGKENSADAEVFARVINDVITAYPAESYGLLIFSHASGWLPSGAYVSPDGFAEPTVNTRYGNSSRSVIIDGGFEMELADLAATIPTGVFDYIVFEACFMAGIEVAYELKDKTPLILASSAEIVHPGFAPVYPASTPKLFAGDLRGFGQDVFNHALTYATDNPQRSAAYSVIRTAGLDALADYVRKNCDFTRETDIKEIQHFDRNSYRLFFDFEDYYGRLLDTDEQRAELERLIGGSVDWQACTTEFMTQQAGYNGFRIDSHSGLTTYIPQTEFPKLNEEYMNLSWTKVILMDR